MLRLLTLASVAGLAAAEQCGADFDCTGVLSADNGGGASAQSVSVKLVNHVRTIRQNQINISFFSSTPSSLIF